MNNETWSRETCPHCLHYNWFNMGDQTDQTSFVGEEIVASCWHCRRKWYRVSADESGSDCIEGLKAPT